MTRIMLPCLANFIYGFVFKFVEVAVNDSTGIAFAISSSSFVIYPCFLIKYKTVVLRFAAFCGFVVGL